MKSNRTIVQELRKFVGQRGTTKEEFDTLLEAKILELERKYTISPTVGQVLDEDEEK